MIRFIFGPGGSGKTRRLSELISADIADGKRAYLLVPEQQAVITERYMTDILPPTAPLLFEVLNFSRMANSVFRKYGGLSYKYANKGTKALLMWRTLSELSPFLKEYKSTDIDCPSVPVMLAAYHELRSYAISPEKLGHIADLLPESSQAKRKFGDISLVCTFYEALLHEKYNDTTDDLDYLAEILDSHPFFTDANVYIDSFSSFTAQEYKILEQIFAQADSTTVALLCDEPNGTQLHFSEVYDTCARLKKLAAKRETPVVEEFLSENLRSSSAAVAFVQKNLWRLDISSDNTYTGDLYAPNDSSLSRPAPEFEDCPVRIIECPDPFTEAEAVAADIVRRVQKGARYRDFAVIMRNSADYEGIIDALFEKYKIPFFMSLSSDLESKPLIKFIFSALSILIGNWRQRDVVAFIKTGLCRLTPEECDLFDFYTTIWSIQGSRYTDDSPWDMNPDGFTSKLTSRGSEILEKVNAVREKLVPILQKFFSYFTPDATFETVSRGLITFLQELEVPLSLSEEAEKAYAAGEYARASELIRLWNIFSESLDMAVDAIGDLKVNSSTYQKLLRLMLSEVEISSIPTTADEVIVGSADLFRAGEIKHLYMLGVVEGKFPAAPSDSGIFTDNDKQLLADYGITLSPDLSLRASRELFFFYRALCYAVNSITLLYPSAELSGSAQNPSLAIKRIQLLLPQLKPIINDRIPVIDRLYEREAAFEYITVLDGLPEGEALRRIFEEDEEGRHKLNLIRFPLSQKQCKINDRLADELFGKKISFTQARLDTYAHCRFSYFCKYVLKLKEQRQTDFNRGDIGNFIHYILERMIQQIADETDLPIDTLTDRTIRQYIHEICPKNYHNSARLSHLFTRLRRSLLLIGEDLQEELKQSRFIPRYFELDISNQKDESLSPLTFTLDNQSVVSIYGIVDRVDTYKRGNDVYVRVIDYKTGSIGTSGFDMSDIYKGLNLQLLIYLFTLWKNSSKNFARQLGVGEQGSILPAGLLYYSASPPEPSLKTYTKDSDFVKNKAVSELKRKGILLADKEILSAMDSTLSGKYVPAKIGKSDKLSSGSAILMTEDELSALYDDVLTVIKNIAEELCSGDASAIPVIGSDRYHPCDYCAMKPVCRVDPASHEEDSQTEEDRKATGRQ
ncbi:MAG: hypothetical protein GX303_03095 [Clostridiales bacterium]|nr:hypothetical protein [Clostridiales bacterium]